MRGDDLNYVVVVDHLAEQTTAMSTPASFIALSIASTV